jgi:hypothetical protein
MFIHIEGFDKNNNFISKNINTHSLMIKDMGKWAYYDWYKDGIQLNNTYNEWIENYTYEIIFNNNYINLYLKNNKKNILTPFININTTIEELKDILTIKDNIYFQKEKLKNNKTLASYGINHLDLLECNIYSSTDLFSSS